MKSKINRSQEGLLCRSCKKADKSTGHVVSVV